MPNNVVYQILASEAKGISGLRKENLDLYVKEKNGSFTKVIEAYDGHIKELRELILKKKKTRFYISFLDAMDLLDKLPPAAHKILRFLVRNMNESNVTYNLTHVDIHRNTGIHLTFVRNGLKTLLDMDVIKVKKNKYSKIYMVNPTYFFKGKLLWVFKTVSQYSTWGDKPEQIEETKHDPNISESNIDGFLKKESSISTF